MAEDLFKSVIKSDETPPKIHPKAEPEKAKEVPEIEEPFVEEQEDQVEKPDELTMLKSRAKLMGISYSNNIGLEALKEKMAEHRETKNTPVVQVIQPDEEDENEPEQIATRATKKKKALSLRAYLQKEKMKLIRVRITNLDPKKKDLNGEILTVANEFIGTVRKFVPFGEATDEGYHVPQCLYDMMKDRKFLSIKTRKGQKGQTIVEQQMVREFALEILPPLTSKELAQLSTAQQAAGGMSK